VSLRSANNLMQHQKIYYLCEVRDVSILKTANSYADLQQKFMASQPSKAALLQFSQLVNQAGGAIKYVSQDWRRVGVAGTIGSFTSVSTYRIDELLAALDSQSKARALHPEDVQGGLEKILEGLGGVIGVALAIAALPATAPVVFLAFVAGVAFGGLIGSGLWSLFQNNPPPLPSTPTTILLRAQLYHLALPLSIRGTPARSPLLLCHNRRRTPVRESLIQRRSMSPTCQMLLRPHLILAMRA
jgi:hypothetical protein